MLAGKGLGTAGRRVHRPSRLASSGAKTILHPYRAAGEMCPPVPLALA